MAAATGFEDALETLARDGVQKGLRALGRFESLTAAQALRVAEVLDEQAEVLAEQPELAGKAARLLVEAGCPQVPRFLTLASEATYQAETPAFVASEAPPGNPLMNARRELEALAWIAALELQPPHWKAIAAPAELKHDEPAYMAAQILRRVEARAPGLWARLVGLRDAPGWWGDAMERARLLGRDEDRRRVNSLLAQKKWDRVIELAAELGAKHVGDTTFPFAAVRARWEQGDREGSVEAGAAALEAHPSSAGLAALLSGYLITIGKGARAIDLWRRHGEKLDRRGQKDNVGTLVGNVLAAFAQIGKPGEGLDELSQEIETCGSERPLFNAACLGALAQDTPKALGYVERLLAAGRAPADFDDHDFDGIRESPEFRELLARDFTGSRSIREDLESDDLERIRRGLHAMRAWLDERGHHADLSLFTLAPDDGHGKLLANPLFDGILARHAKALGQVALLDLAASLYHEPSRYHEQRALRTALLSLCEGLDPALEREIVALFLRGYTYVDDGHRSFEATALDCFLDEVFPRFSGPVLTELITTLYDRSNHRDAYVLLPLALSREPPADVEAALLDRVVADLEDAPREQVEVVEDAIETHGVSAHARSRLKEALAQHPIGQLTRRRR
jgi:hypothetical protein